VTGAGFIYSLSFLYREHDFKVKPDIAAARALMKYDITAGRLERESEPEATQQI